MLIFSVTVNENPLKDKVAEALDIVKYSDPVSSKELEEIEDEINRVYFSIKMEYAEKNYVKAISNTNKLISLLNERNLLCKDTKKR